MRHTILTLLCLWSCILQVTPLTEEHVGRATYYFDQQIFRNQWAQYAYFVKFTGEECSGGLQLNVLQQVMGNINAADVLRTVRSGEIYEGTRMVAAAPKDIVLPNGNVGTEHSEFRLLNPDNNSPISRLLASAPAAGCVIFYSLNSPCVNTCTAPYGRYNIIDKLNHHRLPNNIQDKAFSFRNVFRYDQDRDAEIVWRNWNNLNNVMNLYRCPGNNCMKCVVNGVRNNNCFNS
ncbi:hypothetical protein GDO78_016618 [Eleutherodactylus coqui]|uniref:Uncharacterized protein n=1 Tax=Eleutherodactylus coqui TaxID=57060 RepID=A0A8J6EBF2_ELECQ|nr:hypothetical protein GDO78_016618 [Eleutherodactylus coqui]